MGVTEQGLAAIVKTRGNKDVHVILRGGTKGPNYASEHVRKAAEDIEKKAKKAPGEQHFSSIMVDCSRKFHVLSTNDTCLITRFSLDGNSSKNHRNQPLVISNICEQLAAGERNITGVMIESHINEGRQDVPPAGPSALKHGVSITDACVDWESTVSMLNELDQVKFFAFD